MIRFVMTALLFMCLAGSSVARDGYKVTVKIPTQKDSMVYLVHYYGKPLPTIYKKDSAKFDKKGLATFQSADPDFVGGIYMVLLADHRTYFEILLDKGDDFTVSTDAKSLPDGVTFTNSPENDRFKEYVSYLKDYSDRQQGLQKELANARSAEDTAAVRTKAGVMSKELTNYRREHVKKYPGTLLASIFSSLEMPKVPEGVHYLDDGKTVDTNFAYKYYKSHYWDNFNLQDDRLIHTPVFDSRLDEYMNKLVLPWPDSVIKESKLLLEKARGTKELFKYTLWWLTRMADNSKVMGMDEVFVYLVENYYMKGDATWLTTEEVAKYSDRAMKIAPNVIGNLAPEIKLPHFGEKKDESLHSTKAKYTLVVFYAPSCGHCRDEIPAIDSVYRNVLKKKGLKVFAISTETDPTAAKEFITKYKLEDWINTWDPDHSGDWRGKYDVYSTPSIYLLDEKKIIKGKRLDHSNIATLVEMLETQANTKKG